MESGESLIGTDGGVVKARDFRRKAENGGRWSVTEFDKFVGVPWEPYPGAKGGFELRSKVRAFADGARGVHGDGDGQERLRKEKVSNQERRLGEVWVHDRMPRMPSSEQGNDGSKPF